MEKFVLWFDQIGRGDVARVGGKCANLGEMVSKTKVPVPYGFAITAQAYNHFILKNLLNKKIDAELAKLKNANDTKALEKIGKKIRSMVIKAKIPADLEKQILDGYEKLEKKVNKKLFVAVRSSATAEDLPGASFAGQQETYLNIRGKKELLESVKKCYASLYTNRAIFYRINRGFAHQKVSLSVAVQMMIESQASGVMFTLDVRNGNRDVIVIEGAWGLGEYIVQGKVTPDAFFVRKKDLKIVERKVMSKPVMLKNKKNGGVVEKKVPASMKKKPVLSDAQVKEIARYGLTLEKHYKMAQDCEWALDEELGKLFIVQARPETVWSERKAAGETRVMTVRKAILKGLPASPGMGAGKVKIVRNLKQLSKVQKGDILVTKMTSPDMVPAMNKAAGIVTDDGGLTSHAAIVSRELGTPCVVGTEKATKLLKENQGITVDGSAGAVYDGIMKIQKKIEEPIGKVPRTKTKVYVNLGIPEEAEKVAKLPVDGVGLMREEFILASEIREHPLAMLEEGRGDDFAHGLAKGIKKVAKAFYPRPVVLRLSDFKTNEYRALKGGEKFEPQEMNPMMGWRGCSRYISPDYEPAFRLELKAVNMARSIFKNIIIMLPFPRTVSEVKRVLEIMKEEGLERPKVKIWLMAEIPSNVFLAEEFSEHCDGFSIGSNDLTQLILGVDRDSEILAKMGEFDEKNEAVKKAIAHLITVAHKKGKTVSICGQAPSEYPEFTEFLIKHRINSVSVNPDVAIKTKKIIAEAEGK